MAVKGQDLRRGSEFSTAFGDGAVKVECLEGIWLHLGVALGACYLSHPWLLSMAEVTYRSSDACEGCDRSAVMHAELHALRWCTVLLDRRKLMTAVSTKHCFHLPFWIERSKLNVLKTECYDPEWAVAWPNKNNVKEVSLGLWAWVWPAQLKSCLYVARATNFGPYV